MNAPLRRNLITDTWGFWLLDPSTQTYVGRFNPNRGRVVHALRLGEWGNTQWHFLKRPTAIVDTWGFALMDPATQTIVGREGVCVQRCLTARWVQSATMGEGLVAPLPPITPPKIGEDVPVNIVVFNGSGTYTPPGNLVSAIVEVVGGGGAGGGVQPGTIGAGGGGGSGGYSKSALLASQIGSAQTVIIGAGGTPVVGGNGGNGGATMFGSLVRANGGGGGRVNSSAVYGDAGQAATTVGAVGQFTCYGNDGTTGIWLDDGTQLYGLAGSGAGTLYGGVSSNAIEAGTGSIPGNPAAANTGGGGGGASGVNAPSSQPGGAGGSGVCIITEYIYVS